MSIRVSELTKTFGDQTAVDAISFEARPGEILGFLGPNGAGKSTTMKMLTGFIPPHSGVAEVCGFDIVSQSLEVRRRTGYLPESNPLYVDMYVREYLSFVASIFRIPEKAARISKLIDITGLSLEQHKKIRQLSKGYKQRVGLAQAMLNDPEVLILDEPTSGLDPNQLSEIRKLIIELGKEKTVLLSTHIMQEVQAICDRVIIIDKGKIVADDTTASLQGSGGETQVYTIEFKESVTEEKLHRIDGVSRVITLENGSFQLHCKPEDDLREAVFRFAVEEQLTLLNLQHESRSLEEVFRSLTGNQ